MRAIKTEISILHGNRLSVADRDEDSFNSSFHLHPELELVLIKEGSGRRIIGNRIDPFEKGDMVFMGSNLPHIWVNDDTAGSHRARSIVVHFHKEIFSQEFWELKESRELAELFSLASRGLLVMGPARDKVSRKLDMLVTMRGFRRIMLLLEILHILATSPDNQCITSDNYSPDFKDESIGRMNAIYRYVHDNFKNDITLREVASIAGLTPQSFCRFFKNKTNKQFSDYLNEVRVSKACEMLIGSSAGIAEIAYYCGYNTISYFNKIFKENTGLTPVQFRGKGSAGE